MTTIARVTGVLTVLSLLLGGLLAAPASAQVGLQVTASVTGGPFVVGSEESIPVTLTVTNGSTEERRLWGRVRNLEGSPFEVRGDTWGDLSPFGEGAVFAPGETRTFQLTGYVTSWAGQPRIMIGVWRPTPNVPEIVETELTFQLVPGDLTETVGGVVFADANENHTADPGEQRAGATVRLAQNWSPVRETVTGPDGRFTFADVPVGHYQLQFDPVSDGWMFPPYTPLRLDGTGSAADLQVRMRRPVSESLHASVALDRRTYAAGDPATLTVTLTNTGRFPLSGIIVGCDRLGTQFHLWVPPESEVWGELTYGGPGATIQPGRTRVFKVAGTVPERADYFGVVSVVCDFSDSEFDGYGSAAAPPLYAKVRSDRTADTFGHVFHDKDDDYTVDEGEAVANTRVGLRDVTTGRITTVAVTDAEGRLEYSGVPVGRYTAEIFGPWTPLGDGVIQVAADPHTVPFGVLRVTPRW